MPFEFLKSTGKNRRSQGGPKQLATNRGSQEPATNRVKPVVHWTRLIAEFNMGAYEYALTRQVSA